jgi:hypothetical protein
MLRSLRNLGDPVSEGLCSLVGSKVESVISRAGHVVLCNYFAVRVAARSWQQLAYGE